MDKPPAGAKPPGSRKFATPAPVGIFSRVKDGVAVFKGADGLRYMPIVTSNSYRDRDDEAIATEALQSYVDAAWAVEGKCFPNNPLLLWHDENEQPIGDIVWVDMEGPFLLEVAKERPDRVITLKTKRHVWVTTIKTIWDAIERVKRRWGASHGFKYPDGALVDGVFKHIRKFETSVLPLDAAANPYTFAGVVDDMDKDKFLDELTKIPGFAGRFRKGIRAVKQELDRQGLEHKAKDTAMTKGLLEDVRAMCEKIAAKFSDKVSPEAIDECVQMCVQMLASMSAGGETAPEEEAYLEEEAAPADEEERTAMQAKQARAFEKLVSLLEAQGEDSLATAKAIADSGAAIASIQKALDGVPVAVQSLDQRLSAIEKRLSGAPRRASVDDSTVVEDADLTAKAKEQLQKTEELFPGSGVKIKAQEGSENGKK